VYNGIYNKIRRFVPQVFTVEKARDSESGTAVFLRLENGTRTLVKSQISSLSGISLRVEKI
jgi:hypothetical protein